jgi:uncharacterized protein
VTVWCGLRGWPKDRQPSIFQPVAVAILLMSAGGLASKAWYRQTRSGCFCLDCPLSGTWLGMKLYGRLDETTFRRVVLILLLVSGAVLIF